MNNNQVYDQILINGFPQGVRTEVSHISISLVIQMALVTSLFAVIVMTSLQPKRKKVK